MTTTPAVCIIGGTGFIGRHLCESLYRDGIAAVAASRAPDLTFLAKHAPSVVGVGLDDPRFWDHISRARAVIHLGSSTKPGVSWRAPDQEIEVEVANTARLIRRTLDLNPACHVVYASSGGTIYGRHHKRPIKEDEPVEPATSYALGKHLSEQTLRFFAAVEDHDITVLRIANPVGRWQAIGRHGFVTAAIRACRSSTEMTVFGGGGNVRDYFDVDELAELLTRVALEPKGGFQVFNVGSGQGYTELEVLDLVQKTLGKPVKWTFEEPRPFDLAYAVLCPDKVREGYGWKAQGTLETVIRKVNRSVLP